MHEPSEKNPAGINGSKRTMFQVSPCEPLATCSLVPMVSAKSQMDAGSSDWLITAVWFSSAVLSVFMTFAAARIWLHLLFLPLSATRGLSWLWLCSPSPSWSHGGVERVHKGSPNSKLATTDRLWSQFNFVFQEHQTHVACFFLIALPEGNTSPVFYQSLGPCQVGKAMLGWQAFPRDLKSLP